MFKKIFLALVFLGVAVLVALVAWTYKLDDRIQEATKKGWFPPAVEIYSKPYIINEGDTFNASSLRQRLLKSYFKRGNLENITAAKAYNPNSQLCLGLSEFIVSDCWEVKVSHSQRYIIVVDENNKVANIINHKEYSPNQTEYAKSISHKVMLPPTLFAQFYNKQPLLRDVVGVGQVPVQCVQAITAIEDKSFITHRGINPFGIARAIIANLKSARYSQGGSTISQQLVKNYFLTSEKTLKRKLTEILMTLALERRVSKDKILSAYLNVIYMGQDGAFQVRGFSAAANYYYGKKVENLNLDECAMLAALLNSPGRYNPFTQQENAMKRRQSVLKKMAALKYITPSDYESAIKKPLPKKTGSSKKLSASYFVQKVYKELEELNIKNEDGLKVYTTLDLSAQSFAEKSVDKILVGFKNSFDKKKDLQTIVILVDHIKAEIVALIGGRSFSKTQYNRAIESKRQVGSVMKPIVYLTALEKAIINPLSVLNDEPFTHKYQGQSWTPRNYDNDFLGEVPAYYALKNSLNVPTARLGIETGLSDIVSMAKKMGVRSKIKPLPSLSLGSFELEPFDLARAYTTIASMGKKKDLHSIFQVKNQKDKLLYEWEPINNQVIEASKVAQLVGMMKQTLVSGTARASAPLGFTGIAAGKTGTTTGTKDSWFVGFTPRYLAVTWIGKDDATSTGLTGASGALRLWLDLMKKVDNKPEDFEWPEDVVIKSLSPKEVLSKIPNASEKEQKNTELILSGY